jgi:hypothetical protein
VSDVLQIAAVTISAALFLAVLELVRRRKLREEYSFISLGCAAALLVMSLWRDSLHIAARVLDISYPPALLLLLLILFVFLASLHFSVVISRQRHQIERLVEEVAILDAELREVRRSVAPVAAPRVVPGTAGHRGEPSEQRNVSRH